MVDQAVRQIDPERLRAFRSAFDGEIVLPGDATYDAARAVWNGMVDRRPAIVLRPTNAGEVASALRFAREQDLAVAVRSGGHSLPGHSTCDDGAIIDLAAMRGVTVDPRASDRARATAGHCSASSTTRRRPSASRATAARSRTPASRA